MAETIQCRGLNCKWQQLDARRWQCEFCHAQHVDARGDVTRPVLPRCGKFEACKAKAWQQVTNYFRAVSNWIGHGMPVRPDEEVARIYAICRECEHFIDQHCALCGCRVDATASAWRNKIRMATEKCPIGKWQ
jgi:hypothetical protein